MLTMYSTKIDNPVIGSVYPRNVRYTDRDVKLRIENRTNYLIYVRTGYISVYEDIKSSPSFSVLPLQAVTVEIDVSLPSSEWLTFIVDSLVTMSSLLSTGFILITTLADRESLSADNFLPSPDTNTILRDVLIDRNGEILVDRDGFILVSR